MEHLSNDHEDRPNHHRNSHKLCNEMGNSTLSLMECQWKLRQQLNYFTRVQQVYQSYQNRLASHYDGH